MPDPLPSPTTATRHAVLLAVLALHLAAVSPPAHGQSAEPAPRFEARSIAAGIWVLLPVPGASTACNSLLVEREDGLLIVDAQPSPEEASALLEVVRRTSPKPVRYLVLSHAHAESAGGASAFPESTLVIGRDQTLSALRDPNFDFGAEVRQRSREPRSWVAPEIRAPVLLVHGRTELDDPMNRVELIPTAHAHSPTDMLVLVPGASVLWAGSLLFADRNPYAADADVTGWIGTLNQIAKMQPAVVVPLRGEPLDSRAVRVQRDALAWLRGQIDQAFVDLVPVGQIPERVLRSDDLGKHFDPAASPAFLPVLVERAVDEALAARRKRGLM